MSWHGDKEVNQAMIRLLDALCSWERNTYRGSTLLFIPDTRDKHEKIIFAQDGKPMPDDLSLYLAILDGLKLKLQTSDESGDKNE